jgi:hypothetical protein
MCLNTDIIKVIEKTYNLGADRLRETLQSQTLKRLKTLVVLNLTFRTVNNLVKLDWEVDFITSTKTVDV